MDVATLTAEEIELAALLARDGAIDASRTSTLAGRAGFGTARYEIRLNAAGVPTAAVVRGAQTRRGAAGRATADTRRAAVARGGIVLQGAPGRLAGRDLDAALAFARQRALVAADADLAALLASLRAA